jgi:hypothetical protein
LLQQSLREAGQALCAAVSCSSCCSNPACTNLGTVSESFGLVRGRRCVCGGCLAEQPDSLGAEKALAAARYVPTSLIIVYYGIGWVGVYWSGWVELAWGECWTCTTWA